MAEPTRKTTARRILKHMLKACATIVGLLVMCVAELCLLHRYGIMTVWIPIGIILIPMHIEFIYSTKAHVEEEVIEEQRFVVNKVASIEAERDEWKSQSLENSRLLGISGSTEARLRAEIEELKRGHKLPPTDITCPACKENYDRCTDNEYCGLLGKWYPNKGDAGCVACGGKPLPPHNPCTLCGKADIHSGHK